MTRSEAAMLYHDVFQVGFDHSAKVIDFYIKTGMLKVEEEKTVEQKAIDAIHRYGYHNVNDVFIKYLNESGFKIVEKDK